ncbi:MAG: RHS domain-containing protein [Acidobacteriota bacterium]|nr:RHS domain-containing protein [Acidobacteriota bacterium]
MSLVLAASNGEEDRTLISYRYDEAGNLIQGTDAYRHSFSFEYDQQNRMLIRTDRRGYSFQFEYDQQGRCVRSRGEDNLHEVQLRYFSPEGATVVTKADGGQWTYLYNQSGVITKIIDPYGGIRAFNLDSKGRVTEEVDPKGNFTQWIYNDAGNLTGKRSPLGHFSSDSKGPLRPDQRIHRIPTKPLEWEYGDLLSTFDTKPTDFDHQILRHFPESIQRLVRKALDHSITTHPLHSPRAEAPHNEEGEAQIFDEMGLLIKEVGLNGKPRRWVYDAGGNTHRYHDHDGSVYTYEHTSWDLRSREIDPLGNVVAYSYNLAAQIASVTDECGTTSEYAYDLKDRLVQVRRHGALKEEYQYDAADNLIEKLDANGNLLLTFEIGTHNLKTVRRLSSGENHYFTYDKQGFYSSVATDTFKVLFDYDGFGNRIQDERDGLGVKHRFNEVSSLVETTILKNFTVHYRRRPDGTLLITDSSGKQHSVRSLGQGLILRTMSNGASELTQYDSAGRCLLKAVTHGHQTESTWMRMYSYSGEGDLLQVEDNTNGTVRYEYDAAHRISRAVYRGGEEEIFRYDGANNLVQQPGMDGVSLDGNRLRSANGEEFEYNDRHHIAVRRGKHGDTRYHYDSRDMLVRCDTVRGEWRADYDPLGRRTSKTFGQRRTEFYWDTDRLAAEVREDGHVRIYVYADAFAIVPMLFIEYQSIDADPASGKRYFVFSDHLGTPIKVEDDRGQVVWRARLDPYGQAHIPDDVSVEMPLRFPGHYIDSETGLHYNRFRYYSPELGRYLQSDPLGIAGGINQYAYTANPLKEVDVRGDCADRAKPNEEVGGTEEDGSDQEGTQKKEPTPQERAGYPGRDDASDAAAQRVVDAINETGRSADERRRMVTALAHEDGHVSVGISGASQDIIDDVQGRLPPNYQVSDATDANPPPVPDPRDPSRSYPGGSACSEPRAYNAAQDYNNQSEANGQPPSPVQSHTNQWNPGPTEQNPAGKPPPKSVSTTPSGSNYADPCPSCTGNCGAIRGGQ